MISGNTSPTNSPLLLLKNKSKTIAWNEKKYKSQAKNLLTAFLVLFANLFLYFQMNKNILTKFWCEIIYIFGFILFYL